MGYSWVQLKQEKATEEKTPKKLRVLKDTCVACGKDKNIEEDAAVSLFLFKFTVWLWSAAAEASFSPSIQAEQTVSQPIRELPMDYGVDLVCLCSDFWLDFGLDFVNFHESRCSTKNNNKKLPRNGQHVREVIIMMLGR